MRYGPILLDVERPGRYEGVECGATVKPWDEAAVKVLLAFPDVYEIGTSHLGLPILYEILNALPFAAAERAYAPWPDMERLLREKGLPLLSRESGRPPKDFDLVGITLQYELSITNALTMLDLGGIPLLARERGEDAPIILGGGPVAANPEPFADFFDAFFIGEAEEGIKEIAEALRDAKAAGTTRAERLEALGRIEGVYLPADYTPLWENGAFAGFREARGGTARRVRRRIVPDLGAFPPPRPLTPFGETVHERVAIEVARGCTRGCRFCQAGYLYRPVREREPEDILAAAEKGLSATGHEEVGLLSLSTGDYSCIGPLIVSLIEDHGRDHVSVSLPSLRIDGLDPRLATEIAKVRKTGFTLAPEAGSERLRKTINKDFDDDAIVETIRRIFEAGYKGVKLYFMVGLPFETEDDRAAIGRLARRIAGASPGGKSRVTISVSNFVPKPHTPFQWARQSGPGELDEIHAKLRRDVPGKKIELKYHDPLVSMMEGLLARGDRRLGAAVLSAWRKGCRMDGWSSEFKGALWREALSETGLDPEKLMAGIALDAPLPWDMVDSGAARTYLLSELEKAEETVSTPDCRTGECTGCGVCDFTTVRPISAARPIAYPEVGPKEEKDENPEEQGERLRFIYSKTGASAFLSHLETTRLLLRAMRASGMIPLYSRGFNPHPKMQLGPALGLGTESLCETGEVNVPSRPSLRETVDSVNKLLPEGLRLLNLWFMNPSSRTLTGGGVLEEYSLTPSDAARSAIAGLGGTTAVVADYSARTSFTVVKKRKNKPDRTLEARDFVFGFWAEGEGFGLALARPQDGSTLSPEAFVGALLGLDPECRALDRILKTKTRFL